ncbi:FAD-binding domain-containing protein [Wallemia mellicola]|nr:FAD-binding domain-containing protein [Wallemia mellicola]
MNYNESSILHDFKNFVPGLPIYTTPLSPEFQHSCEFYNRSLTYQPLAVVQPHKAEEISQVVQFCKAKGIPVVIRSGGHDFFGRSLVAGSILIDMRSMDSIIIEPDRASVRVGGGVISGDLQQVLDSHRLFTPTGQAKSVGYVSWACGGGYGFYVGTYGFGVDQILGARVVVANGDIVDTNEDPELLWALRGAGAGTFGVILELRVKTYPSPKLYAGLLAFPLSEAANVLAGFEKLLVEGYPDEFSGDAIVARPEMLPIDIEEPCFVFLWCWTAVDGDLAMAKSFLHQMMNLGTVLANTVTETMAAAYGMGKSSSATFFRSRNIDKLQHNIGSILAQRPPPQPLSAIVIHNNHGKGVQDGIADGVGAVFVNRYQHIILGLHGGTNWETVPDSQETLDATVWVKQLEKQIDEKKLSLRGGFASFFSPEDIDVVEFFGSNITERLRHLKNRLDPVNIFYNSLPGLST